MVAEEALRPGGWAAGDLPDYADATKCQRATVGNAYRLGTVDTRMLNGSLTPDSFVQFFDAYRMAWFCDGNAAGRLDIRLMDGRWQVAGHGQNAEWEAAVDRLGIEFQSDCQRGYLEKTGLGSWVILTDQAAGVVVHQLFSSSADAHTKAEFVEQLSVIVSRR